MPGQIPAGEVHHLRLTVTGLGRSAWALPAVLSTPAAVAAVTAKTNQRMWSPHRVAARLPRSMPGKPKIFLVRRIGNGGMIMYRPRQHYWDRIAARYPWCTLVPIEPGANYPAFISRQLQAGISFPVR
jgi:hypothetical protein